MEPLEFEASTDGISRAGNDSIVAICYELGSVLLQLHGFVYCFVVESTLMESVAMDTRSFFGRTICLLDVEVAGLPNFELLVDFGRCLVDYGSTFGSPLSPQNIFDMDLGDWVLIPDSHCTAFEHRVVLHARDSAYSAKGIRC